MAAALVFRLQERGPALLREVLLERGWEEYERGERREQDWNLYWRGSAFCSSQYRRLMPWQRLNHHPKTAGITRKDCLARNLRRMKATFGSSVYDFSPTSFVLPNDYTRFLAEYRRARRASGASGTAAAAYWICKPVGLSRGRGVFVFRDVGELLYDSLVVVQRYVSGPLLVSGYKFDLRIYACVTGFHPLAVYVHQEGLVRFATEKYDLSSLRNPYAHLTNASINKSGPFYRSDKGRVGPGCKWTLAKFRHFLRGQGADELPLWQRISNIVTLTLLAVAPSVPACTNCVELFGFDVLVDARLKPWLLEVNDSPALGLDCQADVAVKRRLVGDLIDLMDYTSVDALREKAYGSAPAAALSADRPRRRSEAPKTELPPLGSVRRPEDARRRRRAAGRRAHLPPVAVDAVRRDATPPTPSRAGGNRTGPDISRDARRPGGVPRQEAAGPSGRRVPPPRVGGFIRTFPFNAATLKASQHQLDVGTVVQELRRVTARLVSRPGGKGRRRTEEEGGGGAGGGEGGGEGGEEDFDSLLWGPSDPPLLSQCLKPP